jgi:hypothetical protein
MGSTLILNFLRSTAACVLLLNTLSSHAITLGSLRGAALVGQPLDVSVPVSLEAGEGASSVCFDGDVSYGDTRVDASRVSVAAQAPSSDRQVMVRIRSAVAVNEPVVTIDLRVGCAQALARRYVLLADAPTDALGSLPVVVAAPGTAPDRGGRTSPSGPNPHQGLASSSADLAGGAARTKAAPARRRVARSSVSRSLRPPAANGRAPSTKTGAPAGARLARKNVLAAARLELEPVDLLAWQPPDLRLSSSLRAPPAENGAQGADAAALSRTLSDPPHDALRMQSLQAEMNELRAQSLKNQASLLALSTQLQRAQERRFSNTLVYALLALLAAAVAAAMVLGWQMRASRHPHNGPWAGDGRGRADHERDVLGPLGATIVSPLSEQLPQAPATPRRRFGGNAPARERAEKPGNDRLAKNARTGLPRPPSDFSPSMTPTARAVNAEELFDIQQQADFFVSLGQHEQAIELLKQHIDDNAATSPLAYLDLLGIYHKFGLTSDYERLRGDFIRAFNVQMPLFDAFAGVSKGLEAYPATLSRIELLWTSIEVLDVIEASIFRRPGSNNAEGEAFDPEAYRELLLLFSIAKEVTGSPSADERDAARAISILPDTMPPVAMLPPSPRLGLDVDLSDPSSL